MSVLQDILRWSVDRPIWQRDALRRILTQDDITDKDIDELCLLCLEQNGLVDKDDRAPEPRPLAEQHLPPEAGPLKRVQLIGIRDVKGVNALSPRQHMGFLPNGMTIVFGYNGSGESGYARILKALCHARHRDECILTNAFAADDQPLPSATIDYRVAGADHLVEWHQGDESPPVLRQVCFFDSACAAVHVDGTNALAFTPFGLDVLQKLVKVCQALSISIERLIAAQMCKKPASLVEPKAVEGTAVRRLIDSIDKDARAEEFRKLSELSKTELSRLQELQEALGADPAARAREIRNAGGRLQRLQHITERVASSLSPKAVEETRIQFSDWIAKSKAAVTAAQEAFGDQPLSAVGDAAWEQLWKAARRYSTEEAYRDEEFPYVGEDSLCVLCQQPLSQDAKERLRKFEQFVRAETQKAANDAKRVVDGKILALRTLTVGRSAIIDYLGDIDDDHAELRNKIRLFHGVAWKTWRSILKSYGDAEWATPHEILDVPLQEIVELVQALSKRADELDHATNADVRAKLLHERNELRARQWLGDVLADIESEVARQKALSALQTAKSTTVTTGITRESTELTETYVTETIRRRFATEVRTIGAEYLRIELVPHSGQRGALLFKVGLEGVPETVRARQVLSEGEFRCIALAGFFAELSTENSGSALVLDDPVSSLDHHWRLSVANRLAQEARHRQVVVFTHEIAFLNDLKECCARYHVPVQHSYLRRGSEYVGECLDGLPWPAMTVKERVGVLKSHHQTAAATRRRQGDPAYEPEARRIYGLLRETWERCVEELLLNGAVVRFERAVQTQRLRPLVDITDNDLDVIDTAMTKCSRFLEGHDEPAAVMDPVPGPDELLADIESLEKWIREMRKRRQ